jgi:hypothetical protein
MKEKVFMGIDPGQTGAVAVIASDWQDVYDWPGDEIGAAMIVRDIVVSFDVHLCALEAVSSMPKQGVSSVFKFGVNFGVWRGILAAFCIPFVLVRPQEWQKNLVPKKSEGVNKPSLAVARRMFPDAELHLKKHDGRGDALLLAYYAKCKGAR